MCNPIIHMRGFESGRCSFFLDMWPLTGKGKQYCSTNLNVPKINFMLLTFTLLKVIWCDA